MSFASYHISKLPREKGENTSNLPRERGGGREQLLDNFCLLFIFLNIRGQRFSVEMNFNAGKS